MLKKLGASTVGGDDLIGYVSNSKRFVNIGSSVVMGFTSGLVGLCFESQLRHKVLPSVKTPVATLASAHPVVNWYL